MKQRSIQRCDWNSR